jgi:hypothetical protein
VFTQESLLLKKKGLRRRAFGRRLSKERPFFPGLHQLRLRVGVVRPCRMSYAYLFK